MIRRTAALAGMLLPALVAFVPAAPVAAASPLPSRDTGIGTWSVSSAGSDTWTVSWRSPKRLPVTTDRPTIVAAEGLGGVPVGTPLGVSTVARDGRTVEATLVAASEPDPGALDVVLSGRRLDERAPVVRPSVPAPERWTPPAQDPLPTDPAVPGALPITTSDYTLDGITVPKMPEQVEMVGHVVQPERADPTRPLVLFLHGRHSYCYNPDTDRMGWRWPCAGNQVPIPSQLGYDYIQRLLASQGYVTVSIAANGINAQDGNLPDGGAAARSQLVQAHLDQWASWVAGGEEQADLSKVVLVGHSRGGEGVSRASLEIPLSAPYRVVGQVLIAPTDFGRQTTPYVPTVTMLPSCDGDVMDLQGQLYTDLSRDLADGDTALKSSVMVVGANHNFFNTEWTPGLAAAPATDDWSSPGGVCGRGTATRLTAPEQRRVGKAYVAGAVHLFADGDQGYRPMFDGSAVHVPSTQDAVVLSHAVGGDRDIRVPGSEAGLTTPAGATTLLCEGTTPWGRTTEDLCGRYARAPEATPHWPTADSLIPTHQAFQMSWTAAGATGGLALGSPLDLTGRDAVDLRTVVDPKIGDVSVDVRVTDGNGDSVTVQPAGGELVPALPTGDQWTPGKYWAQTLRVDTADLTGIDASKVAKVELVGTSERGRLWVIDLSGVSSPLPAVPARRVPIVDLGRVRVQEGGPGTHTAQIPFTVTGDVTTAGEFRVYGFDTPDQSEPPVKLAVPVPVGSHGGTIDWQYTGDDVDSYRLSVYDLIGHASHDVMLRRSNGRLVVVDDDATPTVSFRAVRDRAPEGGSAVFRARLAKASGFEMGVGLYVVRGDRSTPAVHASDVPEPWLRRWTDWKPGTDPSLDALEVNLSTWFEPGQTSKVFRIPIKDDGKAEPAESLTVRATTETGYRSAPTRVLVPASD